MNAPRRGIRAIVRFFDNLTLKKLGFFKRNSLVVKVAPPNERVLSHLGEGRTPVAVSVSVSVPPPWSGNRLKLKTVLNLKLY